MTSEALIYCRSLVEEARAIALQAAAEQREKLLAKAREAESAKAAAACAIEAGPSLSAAEGASPVPASAPSGTPEVRLCTLASAQTA
jgi:hypothetical protein